MQILLEAGASANAKAKKGESPLHWAAYRNNTAIIRELIRHGADIDSTAYDECTPLRKALKGHKEHRNPAALQELLRHGALLPDARKLTTDQAALLDRLRPLAQDWAWHAQQALLARKQGTKQELPEDLVQLICDFATNATPKKQQKVCPSTALASWANAAADIIAYTVGL